MYKTLNQNKIGFYSTHGVQTYYLPIINRTKNKIEMKTLNQNIVHKNYNLHTTFNNGLPCPIILYCLIMNDIFLNILEEQYNVYKT